MGSSRIGEHPPETAGEPFGNVGSLWGHFGIPHPAAPTMPGAFLDLPGDPGHGLGAHLGAEITVKGGGAASLLHVPQDVFPAVKDPFALLGVEVVDEICGVVLIAALIPTAGTGSGPDPTVHPSQTIPLIPNSSTTRPQILHF